MDAVKYLKEIQRMCESIKECTDCPFHGCGLTFPCKGTAKSAEYEDTEKNVSIVEKWSADHPKKTRQSEFLKMFPNATLDVMGSIYICPIAVDENIDCQEVTAAK